MLWRTGMVELKKVRRMSDIILRYFNDIMNRNGYEYILFAGTALGFYRDGGYIDKDTDVDVVIIFKSREQIKEIYDILLNNKFILGGYHTFENNEIILY